MAGGINLEIELDDALELGLRRAIAAAEDLTEPMRSIAAIMLDATQTRFDQEVDPLGVPWKRSQRAIEDGGKTLVDQRQLLGAIVDQFGRDFAAVGVQREAASKRDTPVGDYARIHQEGGTIRPRTKRALSFAGRVVASVTIPRRTYIGLGAKERDEIPVVLVGHLDRAFRGGSAGAP
ncbi:phage virion morphogenesis protein [Sphingomonas sp. SFZ2018-12]|uniref:phage virion morphogenesis protein n=1 Tax=Sphingomonas sp. SFZ2018-12 TaxID=2683197 RepID=UPI001F0D59FC|nr:phage virion morphogenesis protein [Sphingomonas sp. SFZ2018-12]MCH4893382.1 phage virion morphogenesis protein [Sphingomonas sp. SFZ2018-12]